ncbi:glutaredoxin [Natronomonas moolapensis 8.8.11]|jgi:monothiol glutaredoxin|uniref:Glutaredoxin n=1 Tax=Natronomonas moolapensis (strain DSM 18674 / CECT 7526 / JCM 14361 / 8.8.11) TaxID=268739 RepID=M1XRS0_NATM8|nr:glutaredoxin domain-containing protein [Natronomonas moolapensis]CCQ36928.1 glutaredoxin [Natronomonas moolapensis 8.8.11]
MTFDPSGGVEPDEVRERVDELLEDNELVLFMKGNKLMPQCGYSQKALDVLTKYHDADDIVAEDVLPALDAYRAALEEQSGWETIPQTFVDGEFIGGSDILEELHQRGELADELGVDVDVEFDSDSDADDGLEAPF